MFVPAFRASHGNLLRAKYQISQMHPDWVLAIAIARLLQLINWSDLLPQAWIMESENTSSLLEHMLWVCSFQLLEKRGVASLGRARTRLRISPEKRWFLVQMVFAENVKQQAHSGCLSVAVFFWFLDLRWNVWERVTNDLFSFCLKLSTLPHLCGSTNSLARDRSGDQVSSTGRSKMETIVAVGYRMAQDGGCWMTCDHDILCFLSFNSFAYFI